MRLSSLRKDVRMTGQLESPRVVVAGASSATTVDDLATRVGSSNMVAIQLGSGMTGTVQVMASLNRNDRISPSNPTVSGEMVPFRAPLVLAAGGNIIHIVDLPMSHVSLDLSLAVGSADVEISSWNGGK